MFLCGPSFSWVPEYKHENHPENSRYDNTRTIPIISVVFIPTKHWCWAVIKFQFTHIVSSLIAYMIWHNSTPYFQLYVITDVFYSCGTVWILHSALLLNRNIIGLSSDLRVYVLLKKKSIFPLQTFLNGKVEWIQKSFFRKGRKTFFVAHRIIS